MEDLWEVEISSKDAAHPIEAALIPGYTSEWRAAEPVKMKIRLLFSQPPRLKRIWLNFVEPRAERMQEYVLRWSPDKGQLLWEIVRQQ